MMTDFDGSLQKWGNAVREILLQAVDAKGDSVSR